MTETKLLRTLDVCMPLLFIAALGARMTGVAAHELIGAILCVLFFTHGYHHRSWYQVTFQGRFGPRRLLSVAINALLLVGALIVFVTGLTLSPELFPIIGVDAGMLTRQIHSQVCYWMIILLGIHIGLHAPMLDRVLERYMPSRAKQLLYLFFSLLGIYAFIDRGLFEKLFYGFAFDFWNPSLPAFLYFLYYAAIIIFIGCITAFLDRFINCKDRMLFG